MTTALAVIDPQKIQRLDEVARNYALANVDESPFGSSIALAVAITDLRELLTPEIMRPIMALMNTPLGFLTDRDPKNIDKKTGQPCVPYGEDVVKDVVIEGTLRGFYTAGNELNIISSRFYGCKNGFRRKVTRWKGLTEFKDFYEVPRLAGEGGAIIKARATWKLNGVDDVLEREFAIRVNQGMGADAITGKAERKLLKAVFDRVSGMVTPDGEADDAPLGTDDVAKSNAAKPVFAKVESTTINAAPVSNPAPEVHPADEAKSAKPAPAKHDSPFVDPAPTVANETPEAPKEILELREWMDAEGFSPAELMKYVRQEKLSTARTPSGMSPSEAQQLLDQAVIVKATILGWRHATKQ